MEVKLKDVVVKIKDSLTWGDSEKIKSATMSGAKISGKADSKEDIGFDFDASAMLEAKYVTLECFVEEIKKGDTVIEFTRDWMNDLSQEDGNKLYDAVDAVSKKK